MKQNAVTLVAVERERERERERALFSQLIVKINLINVINKKSRKLY